MRVNKTEKTYDKIKVGHGIFDYFPVILDYDFNLKRPRGLSARVDFFSFGAVCGILDGIDLMPYVFIKKQHTIFENGMILADFSQVEDSPSNFVAMVKKLKADKVYLESSKHFPLVNIIKKLRNIEVVLLEA